MPNLSTDKGKLLELLSILNGQTVWTIRRSVGSSITLEMGQQTLLERKIGSPLLIGQTRLWIQWVAWRIDDQNAKKIVSSSDNSEQIDKIIKTINHWVITQVELSSNDYSLSMRFNVGNALKIYCNIQDDDFQYSLIQDHNTYLSVYNNGWQSETF